MFASPQTMKDALFAAEKTVEKWMYIVYFASVTARGEITRPSASQLNWKDNK